MALYLFQPHPTPEQEKFPEIDGWRGIKEVLEQFFGFREHGVPNLYRRLTEVAESGNFWVGVAQTVLGNMPLILSSLATPLFMATAHIHPTLPRLLSSLSPQDTN